jgi:hypothetical protein
MVILVADLLLGETDGDVPSQVHIEFDLVFGAAYMLR